MKASLKLLVLGLLLHVPFSAAHAQAPSLSPIPNVSLNAGGTVTVNVVAVDVDGRPITLTHSLPSFGTLNTPTIGTGVVVTTLTLAPSTINVGAYTAEVTATAGGVPSIRIFEITVNAVGSDQAPVVNAPALREVTAGSHLSFTISASDPDGNTITSLMASGVPPGAMFSPNGSGTAAFNWTPDAGDAGEYDVLFTALNSLSGAAVTHIRVASPPALAITPIDDVTVADGSSASVPVSVSGVPGAMITLTAALPSFATLNPPGTGTGGVNTTITVSPPVGSAGTYHASVTATSLGVSVTEPFDIIVTGDPGPENHAPVLSAPATQTVDVGSTLGFDVTASDADGDHVDLSGTALPPGSGFLDNGNNTGTFTWAPASGQAGTYTASFTGLDNRGGSGSASTAITVTESEPENHAPTLSAPLTQQVEEGVNLSFTVTASDQDGDHVTLSASTPPGAAFSDQGDNTGNFSWTPSSTQSGVYDVAFAGSDGRGGTGTAVTTITVRDVENGEVPGKACLVGRFKHRHETTCFRIKPVNGSFDVRDVVLSSITLKFRGESIAALSDGTRIELVCHGRSGGGDRDDDDDDGDDDGDRDDDDDGDRDDDDDGDRDDDDDGDDDGDRRRGDDRRHGDGRGHHDGAAVSLTGGHPHGDDDDDDDDRDHKDKCRVSCDDDGEKDDCHDHKHRRGYGHGHGHDDCDQTTGNGGGECDTLGIRACFSTQALLNLFDEARLPCALIDAEIHATLTSGATVVALFDRNRRPHDGDKDKDKDKDDYGEDRHADGKEGRGKMNTKVRPNPLNPKTELSFTMARDGRVRVTVYDMQGRLVKTLLDEFRAAGEQRLAWDGSNAQSNRVASGVYFFRVQAPEGDVVQRVAVVK